MLPSITIILVDHAASRTGSWCELPSARKKDDIKNTINPAPIPDITIMSGFWNLGARKETVAASKIMAASSSGWASRP